MKKIFELKYSLYCIDKQINKQTIKYNNWQENADWVTGAIEINPNIIGLEISKTNKTIILNKYKILRKKYPELPPILQPESRLSIMISKIKLKPTKQIKQMKKPNLSNQIRNIIQTV